MRSLMTNAMVAIAALIVILWTVIGAMLWQAHGDAIRSAGAGAQDMARVLAEYESSSLRALDLTLRSLREDWLRDPASIEASFVKYQDHLQREGLIQVAVVDAEGWTRYSRMPLEKPVNFADRDY